MDIPDESDVESDMEVRVTIDVKIVNERAIKLKRRRSLCNIVMGINIKPEYRLLVTPRCAARQRCHSDRKTDAVLPLLSGGAGRSTRQGPQGEADDHPL